MDQNKLAKDKSLRLLAGEYADLLSIQQDLAFASQSARKFSVVDETEDADGVLRRALWGAAVVAYRRCFTSGRGHGLVKRTRLVVPQAAIDLLSPDLHEIHQLAMKEANEHVAHRVDDELSPMPISLLFHNDDSGVAAVAGIALLGAIYIGPLPERSKLFGGLAEQLGATISTMAQAKQEELLSRASALLAEE
jgi:hypothetical protein